MLHSVVLKKWFEGGNILLMALFAILSSNDSFAGKFDKKMHKLLVFEFPHQARWLLLVDLVGCICKATWECVDHL